MIYVVYAYSVYWTLMHTNEVSGRDVYIFTTSTIHRLDGTQSFLSQTVISYLVSLELCSFVHPPGSQCQCSLLQSLMDKGEDRLETCN